MTIFESFKVESVHSVWILAVFKILNNQRPNSWKKSRQKTSEFSSLLLTVTSTDLPLDFYFFKLTQPLTVSKVCYCVKEKGGYGLRNPYRNLKSENSQDYAQKPERNCTFMNSASFVIILFLEMKFTSYIIIPSILIINSSVICRFSSVSTPHWMQGKIRQYVLYCTYES